MIKNGWHHMRDTCCSEEGKDAFLSCPMMPDMARLSHLSRSGVAVDGAKRRRYVVMHCARQATADVLTDRSCNDTRVC